MTQSDLAASIAHLIISTEIPPGSHVTAAGLADRLGVSRTPVREAIREVAALGLVVVHGNRGAFVIEPSEVAAGEMIDLIETRQRIEPWLFEIAARRRTDADLAAIDRALADGEHAMRSRDAGALNIAHHDLLGSMARAAHNAAADIALAPLHARTCLVFARIAPIVLPDGWPMHARIRAAIAAGDGAEAATLHREHLDEILSGLRGQAEGSPAAPSMASGWLDARTPDGAR